MSIVDRYQAYADDFEKSYEDDDWSRIAQFFTENAVYEGDPEGPRALKRETHDAFQAGLAAYLDRDFAGAIVRFSPDGRWLAIGGTDWVHVQPQNGEAPFLLHEDPTLGGGGIEPAFSPSGERLVIAAGAGGLRRRGLPDPRRGSEAAIDGPSQRDGGGQRERRNQQQPLGGEQGGRHQPLRQPRARCSA